VIGVQGSFYIGWKQTTSTVIAVGLDKNTDSGSSMYYNLNGLWQKNINLTGSLMMRPVFGKNNRVITGVEEVTVEQIAYPNPNNGVFYISKEASHIKLHDLTGKSVDFQLEDLGDTQKIDVQNAASGIYILQSIQHDQLKVQKIRVQR
jgi:hypothetical protein